MGRKKCKGFRLGGVWGGGALGTNWKLTIDLCVLNIATFAKYKQYTLNISLKLEGL